MFLETKFSKNCLWQVTQSGIAICVSPIQSLIRFKKVSNVPDLYPVLARLFVKKSSEKYMIVFLCSGELNHSSTMQRAREKKDGRNTLWYGCTRWQLMGRKMSWQQWGLSVLGGTDVCVCVHV